MSSQQKKFIIIDGNAIIHRAWHALPPTLSTKKGEMVNAVYGFTSILLRTLKDLKPDYIAATFDLKAPTFRHKEYKEYKAKRIKQPDELYRQFPMIKEVVTAFQIPILEKEGYEADDIIATIVRRIRNQESGIRNIIVTGDMDTFQLIDENTEVYAMHKGISDTIIYNIEQVKKRFGGLTPSQLIDFKALRGDPSDNIPGVKGIGEKTAIELLREFETLENIYKHLDSPKIKPRYQKLLKEQKDGAMLSKKLVTLEKNAPIEFSLNDCALKPLNSATIVPLFQKLEFRSLLSRLPAVVRPGRTEAGLPGLAEKISEPATAGTSAQTAESEKQAEKNTRQAEISLFSKPIGTPRAVLEKSVRYLLIDTREKFDAFFKELQKQKIFAFDTETSSFYPLESKLVGVGIAWQEKEAYFIPQKEKWFKDLKPIFENQKIKKIGQNIKFDIEALETEKIEVQGELFDTMVASYLINPGSRQHGLDSMVFTEFGYQMQPIEDLIGKAGKNQKTMDMVPIEKVSDYCCEDVDFTLRLVPRLTQQLDETNNLGLLQKIEMPLIYVLVELEKNGIKIDTGFLKTMSLELKKKITTLENKIHKVAGVKFNIASPIQLKEVLFDTLNISTEGLHKTKTGISSAATELDKLLGKHPIIPLIIEYRELTKLLSTYVNALPTLVSKIDGRVHTSFNQTITATGRLSSSEPNLQNIPIRTEMGQKIRKAFIAKSGNILIAADYSQIELRIIASLANDTKMINGFKNNEDIHTRTAAEIAGIEKSEVTPQMRRAAKAINFGIIYGMGPYGLAMREGISSQKAKEFIDRYFTLHKDIKEYIEKTKELARSHGYVETLFGRRRYLPEINSNVQPIRAQAERMAINHPIQGTAADIMKLAMIEVYKRLEAVSKNTKMLLQVHDELVFETPKSDVEKVAKFVTHTMENIYELRVPIRVEVEVGKSWWNMEKI